VAIPPRAQWPGNDPERTDLIPRYDASADPRAWQPDPPVRPSGPGFDDAGVVEIRPEGGRFDPGRVDPDPGPVRGGRRRARKKPLWRELVTLLAVALLLTFLIQHFLGRVYIIPSGSMEKTLHGCSGCDGDRVLVDKLGYAFTDPQPGDVIVFEGPDVWSDDYDQDQPSRNFVITALQQVGSLVGLAPPDERDFVKRVVAVGGQTIQCCDPKGRVLVDGRPLDEPYVYWKGGKPDSRQRFDPVVVPEGMLWVMGDNRNNSKDSRFQGGGGLNGAVPIDQVIGKARYIVLPPSRWQGVGDHDPQAGAPVALGAPGWQQGLPAGVGLVAAWPMLWLSRRIKWAIVRPSDR
jgi:signal peptidase I